MTSVVALVLSLVSVVGRVVDIDGAAIPGAFVTIKPSQQSSDLPELEAVSDGAGVFRFDRIPPGAYRVAAHLVGFELTASTVEVIADRDAEVSLAMAPTPLRACLTAFPHPVRIRTRSGEPLPKAFVTVAGAGRRPLSEPVSPTGEPGPCFVPAIEDQVTLDALGYGEHVLKRAGVDPKIVHWQVTVEPSAASQRGRAARDPISAQIRGRVFDEFGASIPDASVSFEPLDPRSGLTAFNVVADARGRFDFASVRPGTYRVTCKALGFETTIVTYQVTAGVENDLTVVVRRKPQRPRHRQRSASSGFTREARTDGIRQAMTPAASNPAATIANVAGSPGVMP